MVNIHILNYDLLLNQPEAISQINHENLDNLPPGIKESKYISNMLS